MAKLAQFAFVGLFVAWFMGINAGLDTWYMTLGKWFFGLFFALLALGIAFFVVTWVLKLLGVIAKLPFALDRKLSGDGD